MNDLDNLFEKLRNIRTDRKRYCNRDYQENWWEVKNKMALEADQTKALIDMLSVPRWQCKGKVLKKN